MYKEIKELFEWCKKEKINCKLLPLFDGYKIDFGGHRDVVQHSGSYRAVEGYVEPYGFSKHCVPINLKEMKKIILKELKKPLTNRLKYDIIYNIKDKRKER